MLSSAAICRGREIKVTPEEDRKLAKLLFWARIGAVASIMAVVIGGLALALAVTAIYVVFQK
jgi:hypothetical protein